MFNNSLETSSKFCLPKIQEFYTFWNYNRLKINFTVRKEKFQESTNNLKY